MIERAVVKRVDDLGNVYFTIGRLTGGGRVHKARAVHSPVAFVTALPVPAHPAGNIPRLLSGDLIVVVSIGRDPDDWVVLGRIP